MRVTKTLAINKKHFSQQSIFAIDEEVYMNNFEFLVVQKLGTSEYLVAVNRQYFEAHSKFKFDIPKDLQSVITMALDQDCSLIYISEKEPIANYLPVYEYPMLLNDFSEKIKHEQIYINGVLISDKEL